MKFHSKTPVVFCTTCKGRLNHLQDTLPVNLRVNFGVNTFFILLDYSSPDGLELWIKNNIQIQANIKSGKLVVYKSPNQDKFKMAHAKNMAHRLGIKELKSRGFSDGILVNLDADNFTGDKFDEYLQSNMNTSTYMWGRMIKHSGMARGIGGRIATSVNGFLMAGGYDETNFNEWGCDDKDYNRRLGLLGFEGKEIDSKFLLAINHTDKMRFKEYPHRMTLSHEYHEEIYKSSTTTIVNFGNIGCGEVIRNYEEEILDLPCDLGTPIKFPKTETLSPIATRIFNIGMQKTATTSFHHAMEFLGYSSAHWKSAHWAKKIWQEFNNLGNSPTLEQNYVLADLPIAIMYERLDKAYPGSKFVLTIRDEMDWLKSMKDHWDPAKNPFRAGWDNDAWSNRLHEIVYKRTDFHAETMLRRYRKHNSDVLSYFAGRKDFLVLNMSKEPNPWIPLCEFLGEKVPTSSYPRSFASY